MYADTYKPVVGYNGKKQSQRLSIHFDFVGKGVSQPSFGYVQFKLLINGVASGPYRTEITTLKTNWEARKQVVVPTRAQIIQAKLLAVQGCLLTGWSALDTFGEPITPDVLLLASGLKEIETTEGFIYAV